MERESSSVGRLKAEGRSRHCCARPMPAPSLRSLSRPTIQREPAYRSAGGLLARRQLPARADEVAGVAVGIALEVVLVLGFGFPEVAGRHDLGHHLARPQARCFHVGNGVFGDALLFFGRVENRRPVTGADVVALAIAGGRVVDLEEKFQQLAIAGELRIEDDLDGLGVRAMVAIGGIRNVPAGVTDARGDHARQLADQVLHAPETAAGKDGAFGTHDGCLEKTKCAMTMKPSPSRGGFGWGWVCICAQDDMRSGFVALRSQAGWNNLRYSP